MYLAHFKPYNFWNEQASALEVESSHNKNVLN